jgi:Na+/H+-translocating membrane pyrophosphatase
MKARFIFELIVGLTGVISVLIFGEAGFAALALFAAYVFFKKSKPDEREYQLFYRVGNLTAIFTLLLAVLIFLLSDQVIAGNVIGNLWIYLLVFSFLLTHGLCGLVVFTRS